MKNTSGGWPWPVHSQNLRACALTGQLDNTLLHPDPAQLIFYGCMRLVVSGHCQSLQVTGLGKSLPLTCQQQLRLKYKRRVYSAHTKGAPQIPSFHDRGDGAMLQDTYYIWPCYQDTESKLLCLIHRNKHREAAKIRRQRSMAWMKEWSKTPEKELNEMEISNLSDTEFKTLVVRMLKELSKDLNNIKKNPVRNEVYTNWNKEQFTRKQEDSGWSRESDQWFGT